MIKAHCTCDMCNELFLISVTDNIAVNQTWNFRYNATSSAKSTIQNVKLYINYQYDFHDTNYETFIR